MDFRFTGLAHTAFFEETSEWNGGLHSIYEHMTYDFVYADIYHVLRFLDNHDTDRYLPEYPTDLSAFKQGITFLLTMPGIPQLYYGTELLMYGNKRKSDGDIRKDVPGGWPEDDVNWFTADGRDSLQNEAFGFMQKLLKWREGNDVIAKGKMKHYAPQKGVYAYERYLGEKSVMVFMNGTSKNVTIELNRYAESLKGKSVGFDILTERQLKLNTTLELTPKQIYIIEL